MITREELEKLINEAPLFLIDRIKDKEFFVSEKNRFLNDLAKLMFLIRPDFTDIGLEFMETANACIKAYKNDNGPFLNYFNVALKRMVVAAKAKEITDNMRGGMTLDEKTQRLIMVLIKLAKVRNEDIHNSAFQQKAAEITGIKLEKVCEAVAINDSLAVRSGNEAVLNNEGEERELFQFVAAKDPLPDEVAIDNEIVREIIIIIDKLFKNQSEKSKPLLKKLITARLLEVFDELDLIEWVAKNTSFFDLEILRNFLKTKSIPTARQISEENHILEASASRTLNRFFSTLRGSCNVYYEDYEFNPQKVPAEGKFNVINFHVTEHCNYRCRFCFAQFMCNEEVDINKAKKVVDNIAMYFKEKGITNGRINLAGGEPMVITFLDDLINYIVEKKIAVSIITNGSLLSVQRVRQLKGKVRMIGLSVDSLKRETNLKIGRSCNGKTLSKEALLDIITAAKENGIKIKVNTVVSKLNVEEDISELYECGMIDRIKLLKMRVNEGVNDIAKEWLISKNEFDDYCKRLSKYKTIDEDEDALTASYIIINPEGNLLTNKRNKHTIIGNLLETPLGKMIGQNFSQEEFNKRYEETHQN